MRLPQWAARTLSFAAGGPIGLGLYEGYKGIKANRDRNRRYIEEAYNAANQRLGISQGLAQQGEAESQNARGILTPGAASPIRTAMTSGVMKATGPAPTTLGQQRVSDAGVQMGLERKDLSDQRAQAIRANKTDFASNLIGAATGVAKLGAAVATGNPTLGASGVDSVAGGVTGGTANPAVPQTPGGASPIARAYQQPVMQGIDDPANAFGGIHPIDPLGAPGSTWNRATRLGVGQANAEFNTSY